MRCDEDRNDRMSSAVGMEIEQIERIILDLLTIDHSERGRTNLEFQHQDGALSHQYRIDPALQPQQWIFQQ